MISVNGVQKFFESNRYREEIFSDLNFFLAKGDFVRLIGPNGSGKTTLLRLIKGIILPDKGSVKYNNNLSNSDISLVSQNQRSFFLNLTLIENLTFFCSLSAKSIKRLDLKIVELLDFFNLEDKANLSMSALSTGQIRKASIIRALLSNPKVLLFDEVNANLEQKTRKFLSDYIYRELNQKLGISIIWTTHYDNEFDGLNIKNYELMNKSVKPKE